MKKNLLLIFILINSSSFAQLSVGPKIGMGLSTFRYTKLESPTGGLMVLSNLAVYKPIVTPQIGLVLNLDFWKVLSLRPELLYNQRGYQAKYTAYGEPINETCRISYIEVPINVVVAAPLGAGKLELFAGPSFAYGLGGKRKTEQNGISKDATIKCAKSPDVAAANTIYYNPFNASINLGFGYKIKGFVFQFAYNLGLTNMLPHYVNGDYEAQRNKYFILKSSSFKLGSCISI